MHYNNNRYNYRHYNRGSFILQEHMKSLFAKTDNKSCFLLLAVFFCYFFNPVKITQLQFDWDLFGMHKENYKKWTYLFLQINSSYI